MQLKQDSYTYEAYVYIKSCLQVVLIEILAIKDRNSLKLFLMPWISNYRQKS